MDGLPGAEIVNESALGHTVLRIVLAQNRRFLLTAMGERSGLDSPLVRRFFGSFKLLPRKD